MLLCKHKLTYIIEVNNDFWNKDLASEFCADRRQKIDPPINPKYITECVFSVAWLGNITKGLSILFWTRPKE